MAQGFVCAIICVWLSTSSLAAEPVAPHEDIPVPSGTGVVSLSKADLYSNTVVVGEQLTFEVSRDVMVRGRIVIAKGAPVEARVNLASFPKSFGRGGKLGISLETVTAVDGQKLKLQASVNERGDAQTVKAVFRTILLGISNPFGGGMQQEGDNARIRAGTEIKAEITEEKVISVGFGQPQNQN